jgi:hypothetical protein
MTPSTTERPWYVALSRVSQSGRIVSAPCSSVQRQHELSCGGPSVRACSTRVAAEAHYAEHACLRKGDVELSVIRIENCASGACTRSSRRRKRRPHHHDGHATTRSRTAAAFTAQRLFDLSQVYFVFVFVFHYTHRVGCPQCQCTSRLPDQQRGHTAELARANRSCAEHKIITTNLIPPSPRGLLRVQERPSVGPHSHVHLRGPGQRTTPNWGRRHAANSNNTNTNTKEKERSHPCTHT